MTERAENWHNGRLAAFDIESTGVNPQSDRIVTATVSVVGGGGPGGAGAWGPTGWLRMFGDSDILITSHGWPRFGPKEIADYIASSQINGATASFFMILIFIAISSARNRR